MSVISDTVLCLFSHWFSLPVSLPRRPLWLCLTSPWCCSSSLPSSVWTSTGARTSAWMSSAVCTVPAPTASSTSRHTSCQTLESSHTLLRLQRRTRTSTRRDPQSLPVLKSPQQCRRSHSVTQRASISSPSCHLPHRSPPARPPSSSAPLHSLKVNNAIFTF